MSEDFEDAMVDLDAAEANAAVMNEDLLVLDEVVFRAISKRDALRAVDYVNEGIAGKAVIDSGLAVIEEIFGKGDDDVLRTV